MPKALPVIDLARCTGCGRCISACPPHVLWLDAPGPHGWGAKHAVLHDAPGCTGCAKCAVICPFDAITMCKHASPKQPEFHERTFKSQSLKAR